MRHRQPSTIESISVICKTDKPVERGLKKTRPVPIKAVANELGLPLQQINSFRGWHNGLLSNNAYNLVVTVSFGLLVPARVLERADYGGLNVHPSLLPDLRGSAPITHALLKRRSTTGVSLQTMHPTKFDHGVVLAQSEQFSISPDQNPHDMVHTLGLLGASLLCTSIEDAVFVPPVRDLRAGTVDPPWIAPAPKITSSDRRIDWNTWTADEILLRNRVLGDLWDLQTFNRCQASRTTQQPDKRLTLHGPWATVETGVKEGDAGEPRLVLSPFRQGMTLGIRTVDGCIVVPEAATIEGRRAGKGLQALNDELRMHRKAQLSTAER